MYGSGSYGHRGYGEHSRPAIPADTPPAPEKETAAPLPPEDASAPTPAVTKGEV